MAGQAEVVAVDVGGTSIKAARVGRDGRLDEVLRRPTPVAAGPAAILALIGDLVEELRTPGTPAVGCCLPGVLDTGAGVVRHAPNLGMHDVAVAAALTTRLGLPVVVEQDVRAACLAEATVGAGREQPDFVMVVAGTGLGAGLVVGGRIATGATGAAGEFGHLPVHSDGEPCSCGQRGCVEVYASAAGMLRRYRRRGGTAPSAAAMAAVIGTDADAGAVWAEGCAALGRALVSTTVLLDPALVVLAGGLSLAGEALAGPVRAELADGPVWREPPPVVLSRLGDQAGTVGAGLRAFTRLST